LPSFPADEGVPLFALDVTPPLFRSRTMRLTISSPPFSLLSDAVRACGAIAAILLSPFFLFNDEEL